MLSVFFLLFINTQGQESIPCYFDESLSLTSKKQGVFSGTIKNNGNEWEAVAFYSNGNMMMHGIFKDKKLKIKQGTYVLFYPDGKRKASAHFINNEVDSVYMFWHNNGQLGDSGFIRQQYRTGLWKTWYVNGNLESSGSYDNGSPDGIWNWYHPNGNLATIEMYKANILDDLTCFDTLGVQTGSNCRLEKKPCPKGEYDFESFISENLYYPEGALKKGIEGDVSFEFLINKQGKLTHINFTNKADLLLQEELVKLLKSVKEWDPAVSHNREIDYLYSYTVPFYNRIP